MQTVTSSLVWRRVPICFEGSPGDFVFIVNISLEEEAYFVEGSSKVKHCTVVNVEDGIIV